MEPIYSEHEHKVHGLLQNMEERLHLNVIAMIIKEIAGWLGFQERRYVEGVPDKKQTYSWRQT